MPCSRLMRLRLGFSGSYLDRRSRELPQVFDGLRGENDGEGHTGQLIARFPGPSDDSRAGPNRVVPINSSPPRLINSSPPRLEAAAHAGTAERGPRRWLGPRDRLHSRPHLVERRLVRALAMGTLATGTGAAWNRHGDLCGRVVGHGELRRPQALDLVAQPRRFLEIQVGGGLAHARFQVGDDGLEIVPDGRDSAAELAGVSPAGRYQHVIALIDAVENIGDARLHA